MSQWAMDGSQYNAQVLQRPPTPHPFVTGYTTVEPEQLRRITPLHLNEMTTARLLRRRKARVLRRSVTDKAILRPCPPVSRGQKLPSNILTPLPKVQADLVRAMEALRVRGEQRPLSRCQACGQALDCGQFGRN